jgi:Rrf2 family protein
MRLSTRSRYGIRILIQISLDCREKECVRGRIVAEKQGISEAYLEQILIPLKTAGFVRTIRGRNGGYALNREPEGISVLDVIELFEGPIELADCSKEGEECERKPKCPMTKVWRRLADVFRQEADKVKLSDLVEEADRMEQQEVVDYVI